MLEGFVGNPVLLDLSMADGASALFPQADVYTNTGVLVSTVDLTAVAGAGGLYQGLWTPLFAGEYTAHYISYTDFAHTTEADYEDTHDHVLVRAEDQDLVLQKLLGHLGENVRDDVLTYDATNRPATFRRRIFASSAAAAASTAGGTDEGEILTVSGSAAYFCTPHRWETLLRTTTG